MKQENKPTYKGLTFDSSGEMHFYWWCEELLEAGYIDDTILQPESFKLSGGTSMLYKKPMKKAEDKILEKAILNPHSYTPDTLVHFTSKSKNIFFIDRNCTDIPEDKSLLDLLKAKDGECYIELKPAFDQNNMTRLAVLNQKWVMDKYDIFVNIVIPEKLFDKTFTPTNYLFTDVSKKPRKIGYKNIRTLKEFLS